MTDIFTHVGNRKRIYALASFSVVYRVRGWFFKKTDSDDDWRGPFSTEMSVCLMIAKQLVREVVKRDGLPN